MDAAYVYFPRSSIAYQNATVLTWKAKVISLMRSDYSLDIRRKMSLVLLKTGDKILLYYGYWKVYSNLEECRKVFAGYDQAREKVIHMVSSGMTVKNIMELYDLHSRKLMAV